MACGENRKEARDAAKAANQQSTLLDAQISEQQKLIDTEAKYAPQNIAQRLTNLRLALGGDEDTAPSALYGRAFRLADPESTVLLDTLTQNAIGDLALDNQLDPSQTRLVEQSGRASAAARGMGFGPSEAFAESFAKLGYGDQLRDKRRGRALDLTKLRSLIASRGTDLVVGMGTGYGPQLIDNNMAAGFLTNAFGAQNQQTLAQMSRAPQTGSSMYGGGGGGSPWVNYDYNYGTSNGPAYGSTYEGYNGQTYQSVDTGNGSGQSQLLY